ncbi:MAG: protease pro-enzyme activation domain-containing protein, partial [Thermoplasmata archaeon]
LSSVGVVAERTAAGGPPEGAAPVPSLVTDLLPVPVGAPTVPLAGSVPVSLTLSLGSPHASALAAFLAAVDDPASPEYRHFLTYADYLREFAPTPSDAATVVATLRAAGATSVTVSADRSGVTVVLPASGVDRLLGVTLIQYGTEGDLPLFTAEGTAVLPAPLQGIVVGVDGLSDRGSVSSITPNLHATLLRAAAPPATPGLFVYNNTTGEDWYVGSDYTQAYGATGLFPGSGLPNATFPTHVAIATLLASGYNESTGENLPPWDPGVVGTYFNDTFPSSWPKPVVSGVPVQIGTVTPPLPGSFGALNDSTLYEFENSLDLEMAGSLAPGSSIYNFYFAGSLLVGPESISTVANDFAQSLSEALAYNYSPEHLGVISGSFGLPDLNDTLWDIELGVAAATGVTVLVASGDQGNAPNSLTGRGDGQWPVWPATASFDTSGAVSVGGVTLTLGGKPTSDYNGSSINLSYDPTISGITNQSTWYDAPPGAAQVAGSEGGASTVYPEPRWQFRSAAQRPVVNATLLQGASSLGRAGPDVALAGNDTIATVLANATGTVFFTVLEGTSIAAPLLAGLLADIVGVESARSASGWAPLGFFTPELYRIASYYAGYPGVWSDPFEDVIWGHNYVFSAAPGWDATTGWGGVNASLLLAADENSLIRNYTYTGPTPGLPTSASSGSGFPWETVYLILGIGVAAAVILVLIMARPNRPSGPPGVPSGAQGFAGSPFGPGTQVGIYPGATFLCPFCGAVRPAEPVRCPQCGAL